MPELTHSSAFWRSRWIIVNLLLLLVVVLHSVLRDLELEERYHSPDLRNRVVGARLQKDGKLPYFFHWEDKGELRYADPSSRGSTGANAITASPFYHALLMPVCDLPEQQIARLWLPFSWLFLLAMTAIAMRMAKSNFNRLIVLNMGILFTLTEGWKMHIYAGQLYLFVAFVMTTFIRLLLCGKKRDWIPGGLFAAMLILCRPIALVIGIPLLSRLKRYRLYFAATLIFLTAYAVFVYTTPFEKALWTDYRHMLAAHVAFHQSGIFYPNLPARPDRELSDLEGIDLTAKSGDFTLSNRPFHSENGNIFCLYESAFHKHMPSLLLNGLLLLVLLTLEIRWICQERAGNTEAWYAPVLAWTFYMIIEIFSPVHRHQYNTVEWLPVLFTISAFLSPRVRPVCATLVVAGLVLNISNFNWLPMRHTLGEFCWIAAVTSLLLTKTKTPETWKLPS